MRFPGKFSPAATASAGSSKHGNGSSFSFGSLGAILACAAALLGIGAPAASAAPEAELGWSLQRTFGQGNSTFFSLARSPMVVDSHGNVFVTEHNQGWTNGYASDGTSLGQYNFNGEVGNIAIDSGDDTVYVDNSLFGSGFIKRYTSNGEPTPTYTQDPGFSVPLGASLAVDETTHDILVTEPGTEAVLRYDTTGALIDTISTPSMSPTYIATASDGSFYVAPDGGSDLTHLSATGTVLGTIGVGGALQGLAFDHTEELLVVSVANTLKTFTPLGTLLDESPGGNTAGLAADDSRLFELADNTVNAYVFATIPGVEAPVVSDIQPTSVHVEAEVDPGAGPPEGSVAHFEYSTNGGETWASTLDQAISSLETIGADLEGLPLNTALLVKVKASNSLTSKTSSITSSSTPAIAPLVGTGVATDRAETSATLNGTVNAAGQPTIYHFEYGTTIDYGSRVPVAVDAPAGSQRAPRAVSKFISGLQPGTSYHYRLVAENATGETAGTDRTFTTLSPDEVAPTRAYEQVTPVDKGGASVSNDWHFQTAADGSAMAVSATSGSSGGTSTLIRQNFVTRRGADGWLPWQQVDPPQTVAPGNYEAATMAISDDFEHALVASNRALAPGAIAGGGNLYIKDLRTGGYTFVGGAAGAYPAFVGLTRSILIFRAAAPDFSWIVFVSTPPLLPEAQAAALYRWSENEGLKIESVLPGGAIPSQGLQEVTGSVHKMTQVSVDGSVTAYGLGFYGPIYRRVDGGDPEPVTVSQVPGDSQEPQAGRLDGMTPDGRYVFFHSPIRLTEDALESPEAEGFLYRYDSTTGELRFLVSCVESQAVVSGIGDDGQTVYCESVGGAEVWHEGQVHQISSDHPFLNPIPFTVTDSGRYYGWVGSIEGQEKPQALLYDAVTEETVCVSCPGDGGQGGSVHTLSYLRTIGSRVPRVLLEDGTMYFDTTSRLLASDHNGSRDVYAYEGGRLALISPGNADVDAFFSDASDDGSSVFFQTSQGIVSQDVDNSPDVYVARIGGGFSAQSPPPPPGSCKGAECAEVGGRPTGGPPVATAGGNSSATAAQKPGRIGLKKVSVGQKSIRITFHASLPGRVRVTGATVSTTERKVAKAGTYSIGVPLTAAARAKLRNGEKLKVALKVSFSGAWGSTAANYSKTLGK